ncbi:thioesterase II family protein [Streptomyces sp. NPDC127051]|uniref:thioesterase II family protein n=1 Tax=Streptomyces sp. NPDC127051 TaxID=3347119 RepID=UPI00365F5D5C
MANNRGLVEIAVALEGERVLYAIPHAGAGVAAVKKMCRALGERWTAVGVRLPGRESRTAEAPVSDLAMLADTLSAQIAAHAGSRDVYLYGHCAGAVIAYEVARRLPAAQLRGLAVSAHQSPDRIPVTESWRLPPDEFFARVREDGYLPDELLDDPDLLDLVEPALRADYRAIESHAHEPEPIDAPILALLGTGKHAVPVEDVVSWAKWTSVGFHLEMLSGGHNLLQDCPADVAAALDRHQH